MSVTHSFRGNVDIQVSMLFPDNVIHHFGNHATSDILENLYIRFRSTETDALPLKKNTTCFVQTRVHTQTHTHTHTHTQNASLGVKAREERGERERVRSGMDPC